MVRDKASRTAYDFRERRGLRVYRHALSRGVLLRPIGNVVYFMPPYVITPGEIDLLAAVAAEAIEAKPITVAVERRSRDSFFMRVLCCWCRRGRCPEEGVKR